MKNKLKILSFTIIVISLFIIAPVASAQLNECDLFGSCGLQNGFQNSIGLNDTDPREIAGKLIRVLLGFLGLIATVIIMLGGFKWMTAGGNEDKVAEAKNMMGAGVIGLIIIMSSYGLASFMMNAIVMATA